MKPQSKAAETSSREKLLSSAEHLFAEHGFNGVSVRQIASDAGVNSALVAYYFGSKEGLLGEVYMRHCEPLKRERARLLAACGTDTTPASVEDVLRAFIVPSLVAAQGSEEGRTFSRLRAILSAENSSLLEQLVAANFDESSGMFIDALCSALPQLARDDIFWRFHFLLGTIYYTAFGPHRIRDLSEGRCDPTDPEATARELVLFAAAGFRAGTHP